MHFSVPVGRVSRQPLESGGASDFSRRWNFFDKQLTNRDNAPRLGRLVTPDPTAVKQA
jgi:hypothetical protein